MPSEYCSVCGTRHEYSTIKPKFCSNCGEPFDKAFQRPAGSVAAVTPPYFPPSTQPVNTPRANIGLDPDSIRADVTPPQVITLGDLQKNKDRMSFARSAATRPESSLVTDMPSIGQVMSSIVGKMMQDAPRVQALAAANATPTPTEPAPKSARRKPASRRKAK